jgi:hypothetical protein
MFICTGAGGATLLDTYYFVFCALVWARLDGAGAGSRRGVACVSLH